MKKISFLIIAFLTAIMASAEPANPTPISVSQPDGSTLQLKLVGDEFYHFNTTIDGYTVINVNGTWEYAVKKDSQLRSSGIMAHDPAKRNTQEAQLVASLEKRLVDKAATTQARKNRATRDKKNQQNREPVVDYSLFRGLIILINFNDRQFLMDDPNDFYDKLCNTENYTGFYHNGRFQRCTGSVRDYYYDNSMGQFDPDFDIVGPVNLDYSCYEGNDRAREIFKAALDAVDDQVDFSLYDADNDGEIDMVFFMVAGYSSSYSGNNSGYLWPHMSYLIDWWSGWPPQPYVYDGKNMGTYASSCEIYGWESQGTTMPNAIGTICHEFGHVLGLPDLYDTDYGENGGESNHPGEWDVMAGGSSRNYGRTPVGYSLWERCELGFADEPPALSLGSYTLSALNESNTGYMLPSPNEYEFFLFENRQPNKWDSALPGHGLVITRVDYSNEQVWWNNEVNCYPAHNYYELVRSSGNGPGDVPFPGSKNVTYINSSSYPALVTWAEEPCEFGLSNIAENNKTITFNVVDDVPPLTLIEDFEEMTVTTAPTAEEVQGVFSKWKFTNCYVANPGSDYCSGEHAAVFKKPSSLTMTQDVRLASNKISFDVYNASTTSAKFMLYYSTDQGATWNAAFKPDGENITSVGANKNTTIKYFLNMTSPARYRISMTAGAASYKAYIDNFTIYYTDVLPDGTPGDVNGDGIVTAADVTAIYDFLLIGDTTNLINGDQNSDGNITASDITAVYDILLGINETKQQMQVIN